MTHEIYFYLFLSDRGRFDNNYLFAPFDDKISTKQQKKIEVMWFA
jgi:hypothetical protein